MARVNAISDGQPLTYELLNNIIQEVNKIKDLPEDFGQDISVYGPNIKQSEEQAVKIVSGIVDFSLNANDITKDVPCQFENGGNFSSNNVVVVASVCDKEFGKKQGPIQMANVTVTNVSSTGFSARVQVLKSAKNKSDLQIHYIAIGAGPKTSA